MSDCKHDWKEVYYGHECSKCSQFFAFGCAPWDLPQDDDYECYHEEYEIDWEGRASCEICGHSWWASSEEIEREHQFMVEYGEWEAEQHRKQRWADVRAFLGRIFRNPFRKKTTPDFELDDEIPF